ncbi:MULTISPECIES: ricin-type beta-trefoil lectin domain protein [unclassified Lysobacter]|uniref:RICIN domain-containing protein n=1 Tax=unclassified Lysobacter TaxID=2635362 RepID=UPI0006FCBD06|nr:MULTISPECIES: ricin-type beta-trefoil lectin domain protein [unclassified Lysobacter]KQZ57048.1 hypothetical protein ASD53_11245 [Lysobacter sp. Root559]KRC34899.1 hypothetical protein ASE10_09435 [Lysobacter sp. Root76]KRD70588.1 hypothetical protein ASE45_01605 [Lysobacter sp. Root96]
MRTIRYAMLLLCLMLSSNAFALVAGGMVSIKRQWPATELGYLDMDFPTTITDEPGNDGYTYWAHQFWFKNGDGGYIGLQQRDGSSKWLNFSIWKATGWTAEPGAQCAYFDHEGSGVQCSIDYAWRERATYDIRIVAEAPAQWAAYIVDTGSGAQRKVATIQVPATWGGLTDSTNTFLEDYAQGANERASCAAVPASSAVMHAPTAEQGSVSPVSSTATTYGNCVAIARAACTAEQDCIAAANVYGTLGSPQRLLNEQSGYCLDTLSGGTQAGLWDCTANANQQIERDDGFRLLMRSRSQCLQADADGKVRLADCGNGSRQRWMPIPGSKEVYNIGARKCLDPMNGGVRGAYLQTYTCLANGYQRWSLKP